MKEYLIKLNNFNISILNRSQNRNYRQNIDSGYTGKPDDATTGLSNYGYRDYAPQQARFTTVDPIRDGHNWYVYVNNNPVNWVDVWGLSASDGGRNKSLDQLQMALDIIGFIPVIGDAADGINGAISLARGDYLGAGLSFAAMIPLVGDALAKSGKFIRATVKSSDEVLAGVRALAKHGDEGVDAVKVLVKNADDVGVVGAKGSKVNLANASCTKHILYGDATGGGHKWGLSRLFNGKTKFPMRWSDKKIMHYVFDIATDPSLNPVWTKGKYGSLFTRAGESSRFYVDGYKRWC